MTNCATALFEASGAQNALFINMIASWNTSKASRMISLLLFGKYLILSIVMHPSTFCTGYYVCTQRIL